MCVEAFSDFLPLGRFAVSIFSEGAFVWRSVDLRACHDRQVWRVQSVLIGKNYVLYYFKAFTVLFNKM